MKVGALGIKKKVRILTHLLFLFGSLHLFTFFWKDPSIIYWGDIRKRKEKKLYAVDGDTEDAIYVYDLPTP